MSAVGVLALQGGFAAHAAALDSLGASVREVRRTAELSGLSGLVLPGGESTALLHLMCGENWFAALRAFHDAGGALFGTCAGAILLAREVAPAQASLGLIDIAVARNAYGRQADSFEATLQGTGEVALRGVFIRAPRIVSVGDAVEVLARHEGQPVLVRQGRVMAGTYHPELAGDATVHRWFLEQAAAPAIPGPAEAVAPGR